MKLIKPLSVVIATAIASAATLALADKDGSDVEVSNKDSSEEKCYSVVKAGHNSCYANGHTCAGEAKTDSDTYEWILLPKGLCERLGNGSLVAGEKAFDKYAEKIAKRKLRQAERLKLKQQKEKEMEK